MDEVALAALEDGGEELILNLIEYAYYRARQLSWRGGFSSDELPGGKTPEDFVFETIEKVLVGPKNRWDSTRGRFDVFLRWTIKRDMGHLASSAQNRRRGRLVDEPTERDLHAALPELGEPELVSLSLEQDQRFRTLLYKSVEGDDEMEQLVMYLDDGVTEVRELAEKLDLPERRIYSLRNKLKSRMAAVHEELRKEGFVAG